MCYACAALGYFSSLCPVCSSLLLGYSEIFFLFYAGSMAVYSHNQQTYSYCLTSENTSSVSPCGYKGKIYLKITSNFTLSDTVAEQIYNYTNVLVIVILPAEGTR